MEVIDDGRDIRLKPKHQPFQAERVRLSAMWINRLEQSNSASTFKLAHRILKEALNGNTLGDKLSYSQGDGIAMYYNHQSSKRVS